MRKNLKSFVFVYVGLLILALFFKVNDQQKEEALATAYQVNSVSGFEENFQYQSKTFGKVDIEASLMVFSEDEVTVDMTLTTHSVNLDYDFTEVAYLKDDKGRMYKVLKWSGKRGGHHLEGELTFEKLNKGIKSLSLTLTGIDGVTDNFEWKL